MVRLRILLAALALVLAGCGGDGGDGSSGGGRSGALVWAVGDAGVAGDAGKPLARLIVESKPDRLLYLGDVYENGTLEEFRNNYDPLYGALAERTWPVIGNHEAVLRSEGYEVYWREKVGRAPEPWYVRQQGSWELIALDSEMPTGRRSEQVRWLRDHLSRSPPTTCRIAFVHRARYSAGTHHGDQKDIGPLWNALRGNAVAVLSGHEHDMQRLKPIDGMVQFISGAGGKELYPIDDEDERLAFGDDERFGALRLMLRANELEHAFVADDGDVLDRGTLRCR
jgi:hypothetical protein